MCTKAQGRRDKEDTRKAQGREEEVGRQEIAR